MSLPFFHFALWGQGNSKEVLFDPPFLILDETLAINTVYQFETKVVKSSEGDAKFTISLEGKSSENFEVKLESENGITCDGTELSNYTMNSSDQ